MSQPSIPTATGPNPVANATGPEQTYFDYLAAGTWRIQRCTACAHAVFYPRIVCPFCGGRTFDWFAPSGLGTVYSTTVMRRAPNSGGDLNLCLIDLDEGVRMMSRVVGVAPEIPQIGARVRAFLESEGEANLVLFNLVEAPA